MISHGYPYTIFHPRGLIEDFHHDSLHDEVCIYAIWIEIATKIIKLARDDL